MQFGFFDFEVVWQFGVDYGEGNFQVCVYVGCVVDDLEGFVVVVDLVDVQFVGVWMLFG